MLKNIKTSTRINLVYLFFNLITIVIVVIVVNFAYFYGWYSDSKIGCHSDLKKFYTELGPEYSKSELDIMKRFFLSKMSYIKLNSGETLISPKLYSSGLVELGITKGDIFFTLKNSLTDKDHYFFVFNESYPEIGDVRVVVDITKFIESQSIVFKYSLLVFLGLILFYLVLGRLFTKFALKDLIKIVKSTKNLDIDKEFKPIEIHRPEGDEIKIVADTINKSVKKIKLQSQNLKGFISSMAHEFKTPLMVMSSDIDLQTLILDKKGNQEDVIKMLGKMKNRIKNMNEMLETLFFVSRLEEGIIIIKREDIDISDLIKDVLEELKEMYSDKNISVEANIIEGKKLHIDKGSFRIVVKNLIQNAFKYTENNGKIYVNLSANEFSVKDTGIGMSEEEQKKIFKNFYKGNDNSDGFGLGLYLVRKILCMYGFKIRVESEELKGTKFTIKF